MNRIIARERVSRVRGVMSGSSRRMALKALVAMGIAVPSLTPGAMPREPKSGVGPRGTPADPDLRNPDPPWERSLDPQALRTIATLADLILPADQRSPSASTLGAHEFIDEWVSAPYPRQQEDRRLLGDGLAWLGEESRDRFGHEFAELAPELQRQICDDICDPARAAPEHARAAAFFSLVRNLAAAAVWTTEAGMADLGYVGNVPLPSWKPPPVEVLKHLGLLP